MKLKQEIEYIKKSFNDSEIESKSRTGLTMCFLSYERLQMTGESLSLNDNCFAFH